MTAPKPPQQLTHLRPTAALEMLDRAFAVVRVQWKLFLLFALVSATPKLLSTLIHLDRKPPSTESGLAFIAWLIPHKVAPFILAQWAVAAIVAVAFQTVLFPGRTIKFQAAMRGVRNRVPSLMMTRLLVWAILFVLGALLPAQMLSAGGSSSLFAMAIATWTILAAIYFALMWSLTSAVVIIEKRSLLNAMARSAELMRLKFSGRGWLSDGALRRLMLVLVFPAVMYCFGAAILQAASLAKTGNIVIIFRGVIGEGGAVYQMLVALDGMIDWGSSLIYLPWTYTALVLLYAECRMRREALDIQVRLLSRGETGGADANMPDSILPEVE